MQRFQKGGIPEDIDLTEVSIKDIQNDDGEINLPRLFSAYQSCQFNFRRTSCNQGWISKDRWRKNKPNITRNSNQI